MLEWCGWHERHDHHKTHWDPEFLCPHFLGLHHFSGKITVWTCLINLVGKGGHSSFRQMWLRFPQSGTKNMFYDHPTPQVMFNPSLSRCMDSFGLNLRTRHWRLEHGGRLLQALPPWGHTHPSIFLGLQLLTRRSNTVLAWSCATSPMQTLHFWVPTVACSFKARAGLVGLGQLSTALVLVCGTWSWFSVFGWPVGYAWV